MSDKVIIPNLDIHPSHLCNLHCEQCSHLTNYQIADILDIELIKDWFLLWKDKIHPTTVTISGGEPLINRNIENILTMTRKMWPESDIRMFTNGLLLHQYPNLPKVLNKEHIYLIVSNHSTTNSINYDKKFSEVIKLLQNWYAENDLGITIDFNDHMRVFQRSEIPGEFYAQRVDYNLPPGTQTQWSKFYKGYGREMKPYTDNDPKSSWDNCLVYQECFQLHQGNIYKCAPLAYLPLLDKKFGLSKEWDPYLNYVPLPPTATYQEIKDFVNRKHEECCTMCPANPEKFIPTKDPLKMENLILARQL